MYEAYWKLNEKPFSNAPDPRFLYYSKEHEEALTRLLYAVNENMGAAMLTGVFGCGKTMICQKLINELKESGNHKVALVTNPQLDHVELLRSVAHHLGVSDLPRQKDQILTDSILESIEDILVNNENDGKNTVIIIDEAHVIENREIFEQLRLLLNFQKQDKFLMTLILSGQPELKKSVDNIKQLSQRIAIRYFLEKFSSAETTEYIKHRLRVAGAQKAVFTEAALKGVYDASGGIPRRINHICDLSMLAGFGKKSDKIDGKTVKEIVKDLEA
jgi:type II secretory pathway predicted ATPase ExeA